MAIVGENSSVYFTFGNVLIQIDTKIQCLLIQLRVRLLERYFPLVMTLL